MPRRLARLAGLALWPVLAHGNALGISGYSGRGGPDCTTCHTGGGGTATVKITGPTRLNVGDTATYTLTLSYGPAARGGLDVSVDNPGAALVASGANTRLSAGEVVQSTPSSFTGTSTTFTFGLTVPATPGLVTLYAAGLSADGDGTALGDSTALTTFGVDVTPPPDAGTPGADGGTGASHGSGCSAAGAHGCAAVLAVGLGLFALLRKRHARRLVANTRPAP